MPLEEVALLLATDVAELLFALALVDEDLTALPLLLEEDDLVADPEFLVEDAPSLVLVIEEDLEPALLLEEPIPPLEAEPVVDILGV